MGASPSKEDLTARITQLEYLASFQHEVLQIISSYNTLEHVAVDTILERILHSFQDRFDLFHVMVLLFDEKAREFASRCSLGHPEAVSAYTGGYRSKPGQGIIGWVGQNGRTLVANDVRAEPRYREGPSPGVRSELCVPIKIKGKTVGVFDLQHDEVGRFTEDLQKIIEEVALSIGFMLENKKLYDFLRSYSEDLERRTQEIRATQDAAIMVIAKLAESIDLDTEGHIERVRNYSKILANGMRGVPGYADYITEEYIETIYNLSPLHDVGKVGIRDHILLKPARLTEEEFEQIKTHTLIGGSVLQAAGQKLPRDSIFAIAQAIALYHHEKWDGTGYPSVHISGQYRPLRAEEIPLSARIVALADVYDALTSKRPYKEAFPHEKAKKIILEKSGNHFDPEIVRVFLTKEVDFLKIKARFTMEASLTA